jgi:hypothetical protein
MRKLEIPMHNNKRKKTLALVQAKVRRKQKKINKIFFYISHSQSSFEFAKEVEIDRKERGSNDHKITIEKKEVNDERNNKKFAQLFYTMLEGYFPPGRI